MWKTFFVELMLVTIKRIKKFAIYLQIEFFFVSSGTDKSFNFCLLCILSKVSVKSKLMMLSGIIKATSPVC